jgi:hypothetical protein
MNNPVREPVVAGSFYPATTTGLRETLREIFARAPRKSVEERIVGIVVPHAGYIYSGETAAVAYRLIEKLPIKTVIILGPSHTVYFRGVAVYPKGKWVTPLGEVEIDELVAEKFISTSPHVVDRPEFHENEHSIEVQLPFLQEVLKEFKIVPLMVGDLSRDELIEVGNILGEILSLNDNLFPVVSSDLYHGYSSVEGRKIDERTLSLILDMDPARFYDALQSGKAQACGGYPITVLIQAMKKIQATKAQILYYTNSSEVTGVESGYTVGYGSVAFLKTEEENFLAMGEEEKRELIEIARKSIEEAVTGKKLSPLTPENPKLESKRGVFVTLKEGGVLRGCIGYITGVKPLFLATRDAAISAALEDPRFPPVTKEELPHIEIEISVLSPLKRVKSIEEIEVGKHGILIKKGFFQGLLLPQVATENNWDRMTFLAHTCMKAGLPPDCWKDPDTEIYVFTAEIFEEREVR